MRKPEWLPAQLNPWRENPWFESVAVAQQRAQRRLPKPVYGSLIAGSERGQTASANQDAFARLGLLPHVVGQQPERAYATTLLDQPLALPVAIAPTGVQAVHPAGEVAVAQAAANRSTVMCLSNFASKSVEEVCAVNEQTFFQMYWTGNRDQMLQRMQRASDAGAKALIATLDWSFSLGRDWGSPEIPEQIDLAAIVRLAPSVVTKPRWLARFLRTAALPDLTVPNLAPPGGIAPTFFGAYYEWMTTPPPTWSDVSWMAQQWRQLSQRPFLLKGVCRVDDALRAVDAGCDAISVSNHGGNNLDGTPAAIRLVGPIADRVGSQIEVVMDGGVRRGSDVVKAIALGARAVLIGRAALWGLAANGQAGVENVLDILAGGIDSAMRGLGLASLSEVTPDHLVVPDGFAVAADAGVGEPVAAPPRHGSAGEPGS